MDHKTGVWWNTADKSSRLWKLGIFEYWRANQPGWTKREKRSSDANLVQDNWIDRELTKRFQSGLDTSHVCKRSVPLQGRNVRLRPYMSLSDGMKNAGNARLAVLRSAKLKCEWCNCWSKCIKRDLACLQRKTLEKLNLLLQKTPYTEPR